jgi:hypothetical protein
MRASLGGLDEGTFTEGHELDRKWRVPKAMIGRRLTQREAKGLLARQRVVIVSFLLMSGSWINHLQKRQMSCHSSSALEDV